jgi:peptidoglycan hydrolase-like protein with peptidoglycan-binding domain
MGRIIRLTEQDLARIVRRVIRENNMILSEDEPGGMGLSPKTIMVVQQKLGIAADGKLGPNSRTKLMDFQTKNGLTPDGKLGPLTLAKMGINPTTGYASPVSAPPVSAPPVSESRRRYRNY